MRSLVLLALVFLVAVHGAAARNLCEANCFGHSVRSCAFTWRDGPAIPAIVKEVSNSFRATLIPEIGFTPRQLEQLRRPGTCYDSVVLHRLYGDSKVLGFSDSSTTTALIANAADLSPQFTQKGHEEACYVVISKRLSVLANLHEGDTILIERLAAAESFVDSSQPVERRVKRPMTADEKKTWQEQQGKRKEGLHHMEDVHTFVGEVVSIDGELVEESVYERPVNPAPVVLKESHKVFNLQCKSLPLDMPLMFGDIRTYITNAKRIASLPISFFVGSLIEDEIDLGVIYLATHQIYGIGLVPPFPDLILKRRPESEPLTSSFKILEVDIGAGYNSNEVLMRNAMVQLSTALAKRLKVKVGDYFYVERQATPHERYIQDRITRAERERRQESEAHETVRKYYEEQDRLKKLRNSKS